MHLQKGGEDVGEHLARQSPGITVPENPLQDPISPTKKHHQYKRHLKSSLTSPPWPCLTAAVPLRNHWICCFSHLSSYMGIFCQLLKYDKDKDLNTRYVYSVLLDKTKRKVGCVLILHLENLAITEK